MAVRRMSNETALARNGTLSSKAASRVRRTTPVTVRCQPPSLITRAARPPLPMRAAVRSAGHARGGGARHRAGGAAARASRSPARRPRPRRRPARRLPLRLPSGGPAPRPLYLRPALSGCAGPWSPSAGCFRRLRWVRTGSRRPRRARSRTERPRNHHHARSFAGLRVIGSGHERRPWRRMGIELGFDILVGHRPRALHAQLLEQERERLFEIGTDPGADVVGQIPEAPFEGSNRLLAALVEELLLTVALLPLFLGLGLHPLVHLTPQVFRQRRVIHDDRLEVGGQVDLDGFALREPRERLLRQYRCAVLQ